MKMISLIFKCYRCGRVHRNGIPYITSHFDEETYGSLFDLFYYFIKTRMKYYDPIHWNINHVISQEKVLGHQPSMVILWGSIYIKTGLFYISYVITHIFKKDSEEKNTYRRTGFNLCYLNSNDINMHRSCNSFVSSIYFKSKL